MINIQILRWVCFLVVFLILLPISETGAAEDIYVFPEESIQDAIDKALPGDTILVKPGKYNESLQINQDNLTLTSDSKNPYDTIITGEDTESNVFKVAASNITISGFSVADSKCGIYLNGAKNCVINNNNISGNNIGIWLFKSNNNTLSNNLVHSNTGCGIKAFTSSGNAIYSNYFNNTNNGRDDKSNIWNHTSGNFWSDYTGKDEDGDGIGDTVHTINSQTESIDYRPLMNFVSELPVMPKAIFTSNVTVGYAPLTVEFKDISENASSRLWNLGDLVTSDSVTSDSSSLSHTFVNEGNYTIILNATNENGSDSTYVTITVLEAPDPSVPILPKAKFSENVTSGYVPLTIQFFDFSENAASLSWNFGDGKKSCCPNPKHTFCCPGNYTVSLTAKNENGSSSACITIKVLEPINQSFTGDTVDPKDTISSSSSHGSESTSIKEILGRIKLGSVKSFVLSFTGTR